jgi:predicted nuclease with TOPRIM domain
MSGQKAAAKNKKADKALAAEAKRRKARVSELTERLKEAKKKLRKAEAHRRVLERKVEKLAAQLADLVPKADAGKPADVEPADVTASDTRPAGGKLVDAASKPDASWTTEGLRAAARARQIRGYSRMSKSALLAALS